MDNNLRYIAIILTSFTRRITLYRRHLDVGRLENKVAIKVMDNATTPQEEIIQKNDVIS